jgi:hypothetical protein
LLAADSVAAPTTSANSVTNAQTFVNGAAVGNNKVAVSAPQQSGKSLTNETKYVLKVYIKKHFTPEQARKEREREQLQASAQKSLDADSPVSSSTNDKQSRAVGSVSSNAAAAAAGAAGAAAAAATSPSLSASVTSAASTPTLMLSASQAQSVNESAVVAAAAAALADQFNDEAELVKRELGKLRALNAQLEPLVATHCNVSTTLSIVETAKAVYVTRPFFHKSLKQRQSSRPFLVNAERRFVVYQVSECGE